MICSVEWVQPNSAGSSENTSWNLARSQEVASANSGVQESKMLKSNSSNNFPCLCLTVSLGVWKSADLPIPSCNPSDSGVLALAMQLPPWPQGFFPDGLWICSVVAYHYNCLFIALSQLSICILYSQTKRQSAILCS